MATPKSLTVDDITQIILPTSTPIDRTLQQRYNIFIPSPGTILQLGKRLGEGDTAYRAGIGPFGADGISLQTDENLYIKIGRRNVCEDPDDKVRAKLDVNGAVSFQTHSFWNQWADRDMVFSAEQTLAAIAKHHLLFFAGDLSEAPVQHPISGEDLQHNSLSEAAFNQFIAELQSMDAEFARIVTGIDVVKAAVGGVVAIPTSMNSILAKGAKQLLSLYDMTSSTWKKRAGPSQVTMFGRDGIWLVTPEEIAMASEKETKILAKGGFKVASEWSATVEAGVEAKVFGGLAACLGSGRLSEVSSQHAVEIAARKGPVEVRGKKIGLGNVPKHAIEFVESHPALKVWGSVKTPQHRTTKIEAIADEKIKLLAENEDKDDGTIELKAQKKIELKSQNKIEIEADQGAGVIRMTVGPFVVKVTKNAVQLGQSEPDSKEPTKAFLKIDAHGNISLESGENGQVKVNAQGCSMKGGDTYLEVVHAGATIDGKKIRIG